MSIIDGVFSETLLQAIRMRADAIGFDDRINKQFIPRTMDTVNAITDLQTAKITPLSSQKKEFTVEVEWFNSCDIVAEECVACEVGGPTGSTNVQSYAITECKQAPFTIDHHTFATNDFDAEEAIAKNMLMAEKVLIEQVVQDYITTLFAYSGQNAFTLDTWLATNVGNETRVNPVNYTALNMMPHFVKTAQYNQFNDPVLLSGNLLYSAWEQSRLQNGTFGDIGQANAFGVFKTYWDIWNFHAMGQDLYQYMVNRGATAFASRPMYPTNGSVLDMGAHGQRWSAPSKYMPSLWIDWSRELDCSNDYLVEKYNAKARWVHMVNPTGCAEQNTGILRYHAV